MLPSVGAATATVLLVEDSELVRELVERILEREGHQILAAEDGIDALRLVEGEPSIDLVITDVVMPRMNGPEFAAELRQRLPDVRVLFMSGHPAETLAREGLAVGEEFIQKPFTPSELTAKVGELLERGDS
jgi:CheY-like chemotaxis protein